MRLSMVLNAPDKKDAGTVVARATGLRFGIVSRQKLMRLSGKRAGDLLYQVTWQRQERPQPQQGAGTWLILSQSRQVNFSRTV